MKQAVDMIGTHDYSLWVTTVESRTWNEAKNQKGKKKAENENELEKMILDPWHAHTLYIILLIEYTKHKTRPVRQTRRPVMISYFFFLLAIHTRQEYWTVYIAIHQYISVNIKKKKWKGTEMKNRGSLRKHHFETH